MENRYAHLLPVNMLFYQERDRLCAAFLHEKFDDKLQELQILEVGCGRGDNLLRLLLWGAKAENLYGNDLFSSSLEVAATRLPPSVTLYEGDAAMLEIQNGSFDLILHFTVFSSILDEEKRAQVAGRVWDLLKPSGAILSYDFTVNNPTNRDVRKVTLNDLKRYYPDGIFRMTKRLTLAPPLARRIVALSPKLYPLFNTLHLFRTHILCLIEKPA